MFLATLAFGGAARLATFFGLVGVTWGIDDYRTYREKALEASEIERELVQTQLEALKLRLHPPFLFNALAAILPLIRTDPRAAARTVVQLGDILRLALHNDATGLVPLKTELEYIRLYLQIEQTRLRDRLEVSFAIDPGALQAAVPEPDPAAADRERHRQRRLRAARQGAHRGSRRGRTPMSCASPSTSIRPGRPSRRPPSTSTTPSCARPGCASSSSTPASTSSRCPTSSRRATSCSSRFRWLRRLPRRCR